MICIACTRCEHSYSDELKALQRQACYDPHYSVEIIFYSSNKRIDLNNKTEGPYEELRLLVRSYFAGYETNST